MAIKTAAELAIAAKNAAKNYRTLYVMGCYGAPMNPSNREYYSGNHEYNRQPVRAAMIKSVTAETFGFDCSGLVKGLLWGWSGDHGHKRGGAAYGSNGVPDKSANQLIKLCEEVSTDFSRLEVGELLWMDGHVGIYIGSGQAVEATPAWENGVQITTVRNVQSGTGHKWTKHGKLPWVAYAGAAEAPAPSEPATPPTSEQKEAIEVKVTLLKKGSKGAQVKALQAILIGYGGEPAKLVKNAGGADGDLGPATETAVRKFQASHGLTADGIVGPATWAKLLGV
jgi:hypothetical protein